jgi:hypothetical protein
MSAVAIKTLPDAARECATLTGQRERLQADIGRAKRAADAVLLLELRERERILDAHLLRAEAERLSLEIREQEQERERLLTVRDEQATKLEKVSATIQKFADEMRELEEMHAAASFEHTSTESRLHLLAHEAHAKRRELAALVERM